MAKSTRSVNVSIGPLYSIFAVLTGMIGYTINHGSMAWAIANGIFWWISWIKWIIYHDVTLTIIKQTFSWFFV